MCVFRMIAAKHRVDLSDPRLLYEYEIYTLTLTFGTDTHATTLNMCVYLYLVSISNLVLV